MANSDPEPAELTRRERRKLEVHTRILEAGVELFDARGVAATKVTDICERADVANKTFFNHFPSKRHLLLEIARFSLVQLVTGIEAIVKQRMSSLERIHRFFENLANNADTVGPMHRELLTELVHSAYESGSESEQARLLHDAFASIVREGFSAGDLNRDYDSETLTEMLMGAFYVLMFNWANLDNYPLREHARASARFLSDAMTIEAREAGRTARSAP